MMGKQLRVPSCLSDATRATASEPTEALLDGVIARLLPTNADERLWTSLQTTHKERATAFIPKPFGPAVYVPSSLMCEKNPTLYSDCLCSSLLSSKPCSARPRCKRHHTLHWCSFCSLFFSKHVCCIAPQSLGRRC